MMDKKITPTLPSHGLVSISPIDKKSNIYPISLTQDPLQQSHQIYVLDQQDAIGSNYSSGFHAIKNALLGMLLISNKIAEDSYTMLAQDYCFYETLYRALSPNPTNHEYQLVDDSIRNKLGDVIDGKIPLHQFGIAREALAELDQTQYTITSLKSGTTTPPKDTSLTTDHDHECCNHVYIFKHESSQPHPTHWVTLAVLEMQNRGIHYIYSDSYANQTTHINSAIQYVNTLLSNYKEPSLN